MNMLIASYWQSISSWMTRLKITLTRKTKDMNAYKECGMTFHKVLRRLPKNRNVNESVFSVLSLLKLQKSFHLELQPTEYILWGPTKLLYAINHDSGKRETSIQNYIKANPSAMSAWQVYLLETSPLLWYRGYEERTFIFQKKPS